MPEYVYESVKNKDFPRDEAIIVLPDIYCQTDYSKRTTEEFALNFKKPVFLLDYFFISTNEANNLDEVDKEKAHDLMVNFDPLKFVSFFQKALEEIQNKYPQITTFSVTGFCFGGRLAYVAGGADKVSRVISFYGGGANTPDYIESKTPIEYLIEKKRKNISVTSFFGLNDPSISLEDRVKIKQSFVDAEADFNFYEYEAGHAYFQEGRKNFNEAASKASWEILKNIFHD